MPQGKPYKRPQSDTTRLKSNIARRDSTVRALTRAMAREPNEGARKLLERKALLEHNRSNTETRLLDQLRKAAPKGTHKSFARDTEGFDGAACTSESSPKPPRMSIPRGNPTPDRLPSATGRPALARTSDGLEAQRTTTRTIQAGDSRPESSSGRGTRAAVSSFEDSRV